MCRRAHAQDPPWDKDRRLTASASVEILDPLTETVIKQFPNRFGLLTERAHLG